MENAALPGTTPTYPFPTPEISIDPEYQALYNEWAKQRDAKPVTLEDKLSAVKSSPEARTQIIAMSIGMIVLCLVLKIVFSRIASGRRGIESRMTSRTCGRVVKVRKAAIGRRIVHYATVLYERDGYERSDEYLLGGGQFYQPGDEVTVRYDPRDTSSSMLGEAVHPNGREFDVVLIPFLVISVIALLWILF